MFFFRYKYRNNCLHYCNITVLVRDLNLFHTQLNVETLISLWKSTGDIVERIGTGLPDYPQRILPHN